MGKFEHLEDSLQKGIFRFCPATYYKNNGHNAAVFDDELHFEIHAKFQQWITKRELGELRYTVRERSDYYLLCFCENFDLRLFS